MSYRPDTLTIQIGRTEGERSFVWLQDAKESGAYLEITTKSAYEANGFTAAGTKRYEAKTAPVRMRGDLTSCRVTVSDLAPNDYVYRVGCEREADTECYPFTVRAELDKRQSFFMFSDLHTNVYRRPLATWDPTGEKKQAQLDATMRHAAAFADTPDFFLSVGDNVSVCNMPASFYPDPTEFSNRRAADYAFCEYREFLSTPLLKSIPFASVLGNHDAVLLKEYEDVGDVNNALYQMPNDDGFSGHYADSSSGNFYFKSGKLLVVGINAMVNTTENTKGCTKEVHRAFIERAVTAHPDVAFRILLCHVPAYSWVEGAPIRLSSGKPTENAQMAAFFGELCEPFGFDLVFTGHQHAFSRSYPIMDGRVVGAAESDTVIGEDGKRSTTLLDPQGVIHYNLFSAYGHSFVSDLAEHPEEYYESYGASASNIREAREKGCPNLDPFGGVAYPYAPAYAYVTVSEEGGLDVFTVRAVSVSDFGVFDTLVLKKSR